MFDSSKSYEVLASVDGAQVSCTLTNRPDGWVLSCPSMTQTEGWSDLASMSLSLEALDTIKPFQDSGQYFTSMNLKTDGGNLRIA